MKAENSAASFLQREKGRTCSILSLLLADLDDNHNIQRCDALLL